jgi:hypothetical protein
MQPLPDPGALPLIQPAPAGHARAEAKLGRQMLPGDPGVQHKQDPLQRQPIVETLAGWETDATLVDQSALMREFAQIWQAAEKKFARPPPSKRTKAPPERGFRLQGRQDSNLQPPVLETGALPVELRPSAVRDNECTPAS